MRNGFTWWIVAALMLLLDFYVYQAVKTIAQSLSPFSKTGIQFVYWGSAIFALTCLLSLPYFQSLQTNRFFRNYIFSIFVGIFIAKLVGSVFFLIDDVRRLLTWIILKINSQKEVVTETAINGISRSTFLSWAGIGVGSTLFGTLLYGFSNKYNYKIKRIPLFFDNLPKAFKGLKIVHISDIHSGSFNDKIAVN